MTGRKYPRIAIVGAHCEGKALAELVSRLDLHKIEIVADRFAAEKCEGFTPMSEPIPIEITRIIDPLPQLPETRAERRAKARKKRNR